MNIENTSTAVFTTAPQKPTKPKRTNEEKLSDCYVQINKLLEQELSEKNAEIADNKKRISELTNKAVINENFEEWLNALFAVFEDTANTGVI